MYHVTQRAAQRAAPIGDLPQSIKTAAGFKVLILDKSHLHYAYSKASLLEMEDAECLSHHYHAQYYYADIVILKMDEQAKILKGRKITANSYLNVSDIKEFLSLLNTITKTTIKYAVTIR